MRRRLAAREPRHHLRRAVAQAVAAHFDQVIAEYKLPAIFHSGHSGIGSGMRCGGGLRLQSCFKDEVKPLILEGRAHSGPAR